MPTARTNDRCAGGRQAALRWLRFLVGLTALVLFVALLASGVTPPGIAGDVLRHNRACDIDASPMVPSEVDHMRQLEARVRQMRAEARDRAASESARP